MPGVRVKICGITNREDALAAVNAGVDVLGFVFAPSPRRVSPEVAKKIISSLPPFVITVGVFVNEAPGRIRETVSICRLNSIQFHGEEPADICDEFGSRAIKAVRVRDESSLLGLEKYRVSALLLDSYSDSALGGTGTTFSWDLAVKAKSFGKPIILSGGLTVENVAEAIGFVKPYAVDVSSGVETAPGEKDHRLMREFIRIANLNYS